MNELMTKVFIEQPGKNTWLTGGQFIYVAMISLYLENSILFYVSLSSKDGTNGTDLDTDLVKYLIVFWTVQHLSKIPLLQLQ